MGTIAGNPEHARGRSTSGSSAEPSPVVTASSAPRLTIGLPTYNGERYLEAAVRALLEQTFGDFELVISDNASTDGTAAVCRALASEDERIRYLRQPTNIGSAANHNVLIDEARGELFKWASDDDLYDHRLLQRCVDLLDADPDVVLAHSGDCYIGPDDQVIGASTYRLVTGDPSPRRRFRSVLYERGGNDFYGVMRTDVLRRTHRHGSYHNADRTFVAEMALHGRFAHDPEVLYFRRDHADRSERSTGRVTDDRPSTSGSARLREMRRYVAEFAEIVRTAPLSRSERVACFAELSAYVCSRVVPVHRLGDLDSEDPAVRDRAAQSTVIRGWHRFLQSARPTRPRHAQGDEQLDERVEANRAA
jgi:glycosyltransferase involved in cell wall biosynthesis